MTYRSDGAVRRAMARRNERLALQKSPAGFGPADARRVKLIAEEIARDLPMTDEAVRRLVILGYTQDDIREFCKSCDRIGVDPEVYAELV